MEYLNVLKELPGNFMKCGITGWCLEVMFTSVESVMARDWRLMGRTSLLMFPIYGCAAVIAPLYHRLASIPAAVRGCLYTVGIFVTEFFAGSFLKHLGICPWDYSHTPFHYRGVIRLDYAPVWFVTGLLFEKILSKSS